MAIIDEDLLDLFGIDTVEMGRGFLLKDEDWKPWILPDGMDCEIPFYKKMWSKPGTGEAECTGIDRDIQTRRRIYIPAGS